MLPTARPRRRWEYDIKMGLTEGGREDDMWMEFAYDRDQWRSSVIAS
jgi:hypothetical protein